MFKKAREKAMQILSERDENDVVPALEDTPAEEVTGEESSVVEESLSDDVESVPNEETEEVPDENVENLGGSEVGGEDDTSSTAEAVSTTPTGEGNVDIEAVMAENKAMKEEIENLRKALQQSGELSKEGIVAVATDDFDDIDMSALVYGDESARKEISAKLVARVLNAVRSEAAPILKERDEAMHALEVQKAIKVLSSLEDDFPGFGKEADVIEALIGRDKVLASYEDPMQARIAGYLINEGLKAVEKGKAGMSLDELMDLYRKNEEFKTAVEKERLQLLEETGDIPVIPMDGGGLSSAAPYEAPEGPKTLEEAHKLVKKMYKKG